MESAGFGLKAYPMMASFDVIICVVGQALTATRAREGEVYSAHNTVADSVSMSTPSHATLGVPTQKPFKLINRY